MTGGGAMPPEGGAGRDYVRRLYARPDVLAGAAALKRLGDPSIGADRSGEGKYAVYFYDPYGHEVLSVGGFESVKEAAGAVRLIVAEQVVEAPARDDRGADRVS